MSATQTTILLLPAEHINRVNLTYVESGLDYLWYRDCEGGQFAARVAEDLDGEVAWRVENDETRETVGYVSYDSLNESGGWLRILADGATLTGYTYPEDPELPGPASISDYVGRTVTVLDTGATGVVTGIRVGWSEVYLHVRLHGEDYVEVSTGELFDTDPHMIDNGVRMALGLPTVFAE